MDASPHLFPCEFTKVFTNLSVAFLWIVRGSEETKREAKVAERRLRKRNTVRTNVLFLPNTGSNMVEAIGHNWDEGESIIGWSEAADGEVPLYIASSFSQHSSDRFDVRLVCLI
jgi:hypothetical protein